MAEQNLSKHTKHELLVYPVIVSERHDDGNYFIVTSPNIPGMVTDGKTFSEAMFWSQDAIATAIVGTEFPEPMDPTDWYLEDNEKLVYVAIDMDYWKLRLDDFKGFEG